jgi:hypothetical protein
MALSTTHLTYIHPWGAEKSTPSTTPMGEQASLVSGKAGNRAAPNVIRHESDRRKAELIAVRVRSWSRQDDSPPELIGRKRVDWSIFQDGTTVPLPFHPLIAAFCGGGIPSRGRGWDVVLEFEGNSYLARLINADRAVSSDTVQLRWDSNRELREALALSFRNSLVYLGVSRLSSSNAVRLASSAVPEHLSEYLDFYGTETAREFRLVPARSGWSTRLLDSWVSPDEAVLEAILDRVHDAEFCRWCQLNEYRPYLEELIEARRFQHDVARFLRKLYGGQCQVCVSGCDLPGSMDVSEVHYLGLSDRTQATSLDRSLLVCPSHHRLLHTGSIMVNSARQQVTERSGRSTRLALDRHLMILPQTLQSLRSGPVRT